jgi:two-component system, LuxR family, sensor kinase FixL
MKSFGYAEVDELPAREPQSGSAEPGLDIAAPAAFLGLAFVYFILSFVGHWLGSNAVEDPILSPSTGLVLTVFASTPRRHWRIAVLALACGGLAATAIERGGLPEQLTLWATGVVGGAIGASIWSAAGSGGGPLTSLRSLALFAAILMSTALLVALMQHSAFALLGLLRQDFAFNLMMRWVSCLLSMLVTVPFLYIALRTRLADFGDIASVENLFLVFLVLLLMIGSGLAGSGRLMLLGNLLLIPILLWVAVRCHHLVTTGLLLLLAVGQVYLAFHGKSLPGALGISVSEATLWSEAVIAMRSLAVLLITAETANARSLSARERLQRQRLGSIIDTSTDGIIAIDEWGIVHSLNQAAQAIFGHEEREIVGRNVSMLMPAYYRERHDGYLERYLRTGERRIIGIGRVVTGQRKDGSTFPMELSVGEVKMDEHRVFTGFVRDISARQETEQRLHELQEELLHVSRISAMGELASAIAHELNQPLAAIKNYSTAGKLMLRQRKGAGGVSEIFDKVNGQAGRAGDVIKRLRSFISNKKVETAPSDIYQIITEASALALIGAKEEGIKATFVRDPKIPPVAVDRVQIQQVLINLIRNAVDAMRDAPVRELYVESKLEDGHVLVRVCDTGPGIPPDVEQKLFLPFFSSKPGGMGIGLSISRTIAEAHGGTLTYQPNPDGGAIFTLDLPVLTAKELSIA